MGILKSMVGIDRYIHTNQYLLSISSLMAGECAFVGADIVSSWQ